MGGVGLPALVILFTACAAAGNSASPADAGRSDHQAFWVFMRDRPECTADAREAALSRRLVELSPEAVCRRSRRRTDPGLVDERDLPVSEAYVTAVGATGARV